MFVIGSSNASVFQYSLSSGFDISTASNAPAASFDVSGQETTPRGVAFSDAGTVMFVVGDSSNSVHQYSLSSGFDVSTASFAGTSFDVSGQDSTPEGVTFNNDGTVMFVVGSSNASVFQYSLSSGFDVSTASFAGTSFDVSGQAPNSTGIAFNSNGTTMFIVGDNRKSIHQYFVGAVGPK
jgi:sugar lactone lactonase YvrE